MGSPMDNRCVGLPSPIVARLNCGKPPDAEPVEEIDNFLSLRELFCAAAAETCASVMGLMLQMQADQLGVPVRRPVMQETTALGAAYLAGLSIGVWPSMDTIAENWELDVEVMPRAARDDAAYAGWKRAVERSRDWAREDA